MQPLLPLLTPTKGGFRVRARMYPNLDRILAAIGIGLYFALLCRIVAVFFF